MYCTAWSHISATHFIVLQVPTAEDEQYHSKDLGADIFGREKVGGYC
jgi:hypothetical protein